MSSKVVSSKPRKLMVVHLRTFDKSRKSMYNKHIRDAKPSKNMLTSHWNQVRAGLRCGCPIKEEDIIQQKVSYEGFISGGRLFCEDKPDPELMDFMKNVLLLPPPYPCSFCAKYTRFELIDKIERLKRENNIFYNMSIIIGILLRDGFVKK